jgi:hypothetical protein
VRARTRNLFILLIALIPVSFLARAKNWGSNKPAPRSVFIQAYDSSGKPIKTTVSFPIRATRDPRQPVVTAKNLGVQIDWLDRGVPLRFMIMSPGCEPVGADFAGQPSPRINVQLRAAK